MRPSRFIATAIGSASLASSTACVSSAPLSVTTWGEAFIEEGMPADAFEDAWAVTFSKFLVVVSAVEIKDAAGTPAAAVDGLPAVFDLVQPGPVVVAELGEVTAQRYDDVSAVVAPAVDAVAGSASDADTAVMVDGGFSVLVEGNGVKGEDTFSFSWAFSTATRYGDCETDGEGNGIVVRAGEDNSAELTMHGDHFFYDDLAAADAVLRADAIFSADGADGSAADGDVTLDELDAVDLTTLPTDQYGNAGAAESLGDFAVALSRTVLHLNGEGECSLSQP
jgi:hypothetical protein